MKIIRQIILGMLFISTMGSISCMSRKVIMVPEIMKESLIDFRFGEDIGMNMNYYDVRKNFIQDYDKFGAEINSDGFAYKFGEDIIIDYGDTPRYLYRSFYDMKKTEDGEIIRLENREDLGKQVTILGIEATKTLEEMHIYHTGRISKISTSSHYLMSDEDYNVLIQRYIEVISAVYGEPDREHIPERNDYIREIIWEIEDSKTFLAKEPIYFVLTYYDIDVLIKRGISEEERGKYIALSLAL